MKNLILLLSFLPLMAYAEVNNLDIEKIQAKIHSNPIFKNTLDQCPADQKLSDGIKTTKTYFKKQQSCQNNIKICYAKCLDKDGYACYFTALELQRANYKIDAEKLFQKGCESGVPTACTNRASGIEFYAQQALSIQQNQCITKSFKQTCDMNDPWGCTMYASKLISGIESQIDYQKALKILNKSCQLAQDHPACIQSIELKQYILNTMKKK
ncbi:hypothetical protein [Acinetobacter bereziniae]|uniref:hypothetical protein n=1 Tax=Acinetobacter bereziniae TaxID=106648 RepID=UPI00300A4D22